MYLSPYWNRIIVSSYKSLNGIRYKGTKFLDEIFQIFEGESGEIAGSSNANNKKATQEKDPSTSYAAPLWIRNEQHKV